MEISGADGSLQQAVSLGISKEAMQINSQLVNDLMSKTLDNTQDIARASQGVGTQLNITV